MTDYYSVDYYSSNIIWIGSYNKILKTSNGGNTWSTFEPISNMSNQAISPSYIYDIIGNSLTGAIASGLFLTGNTELIISTVNNGSNWAYAHSSNTGTLPRYMKSLDLLNTTAIAVGNGGRILRSSNSGSSWNQIASGTTARIYDVKFSSPDTVFACGNGVFLKSFNGGLSWSVTSLSGAMINLDCDGKVVYLTQTSSNQLLKSTDYGSTFASLTLPFTARGAIYAINQDTILLSGSDGLYISMSGGSCWEKFLLPDYQEIKMIDFLNDSACIAVGVSGYTKMTGNIFNEPMIPISLFMIQGNTTSFCEGDTLTLLNQTCNLPGYSYSWLYDGNLFSNDINTGIRLNSGGMHVISLVATNASGSDTATSIINVTGHYINPLMLSADNDSLCSGRLPGIILQNSQIGVQYQLRNNNGNIGSSKAGTGGTLFFLGSSPLSVSTTFSVKATKTTQCFTDSLIQQITIFVNNDSLSPTEACIPEEDPTSLMDAYGIIHFALGDIDNTSSHLFGYYKDYSCCKNSDLVLGSTYPFSISTFYDYYDVVAGWLDLNNDGTFSDSELMFVRSDSNNFYGTYTVPATFVLNQKIRMRVASQQNMDYGDGPCFPYPSVIHNGEVEDYSITIRPAPVAPTSGFSYTSAVSCNTLITFTNTSYNGTSFLWDFGDGSPMSTALHPTHSYTVSGNYQVTLTATNQYGSHVFSQNLTITNPQIPIAPQCSPWVSNNTPRIYSLQQAGYPLFFVWGPTTHDYTCLAQFYFRRGALYELYTSTNANSFSPAYFTAFLDANNDGQFSSEEAIIPGNQGFIYGSDIAYLRIPAIGVDSTPLRMRFEFSGNYIYNSCNVSGGDYKDVTAFLSSSVGVDFEADTTHICTTMDTVTVHFTNTSVGATSFLWDFGDGTTSTDVSPAHTYNAPGIYTVKLRGNNAIDTGSLERANYIGIYNLPPPPTISLAGNLLSTPAIAGTYQWFMNGTLINGADSSIFEPLQHGNYSVLVTDTAGCSNTSAGLFVTVLTAEFRTNDTVFCGGTSPVPVSFENLSVSANSYQWSFGDGTFSTDTNPHHIYNSPGIYTVQLVACQESNCDTMTIPDYITILSDTFAITMTPATLLLECAEGFTGADFYSPYDSGYTYQWLLNSSPVAGETDTTIEAFIQGSYAVAAVNLAGCKDTSESCALILDSACVWPGDADHNGITNHFDLLPLGIFYGESGPARNQPSITWTPAPAMNWSGIYPPTQSNSKHADCNGDGLIDESDNLAIQTNFSSTYVSKQPENNNKNGDLWLYFESDTNIFHAGDWVYLRIVLDPLALSDSGISGIAFGIPVDTSLIEVGSLSFAFNSSWLAQPGMNALQFIHMTGENDMIYAAIVRKDHRNVNGSGSIATLLFRVRQSITTEQSMVFNYSDYQAVDSSGVIVPLQILPYTLIFRPSSTNGSKQIESTQFSVWPNPSSGQMTLFFSEAQTNIAIRILNVLGEEVWTSAFSGLQLTMDTKAFLPGMYFLQVYTDPLHVKNIRVVFL